MTAYLRTLEQSSAPSFDDVYALCSCGATLFGFDEARAHLSTSASVRDEQAFHSSTRYLVSDHTIRVIAPDPEAFIACQDELPGLSTLCLLTGWDRSDSEKEVA